MRSTLGLVDFSIRKSWLSGLQANLKELRFSRGALVELRVAVSRTIRDVAEAIDMSFSSEENNISLEVSESLTDLRLLVARFRTARFVAEARAR